MTIFVYFSVNNNRFRNVGDGMWFPENEIQRRKMECWGRETESGPGRWNFATENPNPVEKDQMRPGKMESGGGRTEFSVEK